jgi:UDP-N-acetylglucosamine transferase subunit ALG13
VGTQKFQFNRLFKELDYLCEKEIIREEIFAQIGNSTYKPKNYRYRNYIDDKTFQKYIQNSNFVISHAGTSSIIHSLRAGKKVIVMPRRKMYSEHVDDHQVEIARLFKEKNYVTVANNINELEKAIITIKDIKCEKFKSSNGELLESIRLYVKQVLN